MSALLCVALALLVAPAGPVVGERLGAALPPRADAGTPGPPAWRRALGRLPLPRGHRVPELGPRVYELLAVALRSGLPPHLAVAAVAEATDPGEATGPGEGSDPGGAVTTARALRTAAGRMHLGAGPAEACAGVAGGSLEALGVVLERSVSGGGGAGAALEHAATRARAAEDAAALARAERAGVLVAGPLGLCFLPAFVCLGVAPVVVGLAGDILPGVTP